MLLKNYKIRMLNGILVAASFHFGMTNPILMFSNKILEGNFNFFKIQYFLEHHSKSTANLFTTLTPIMDFFSLIPSMYLVKIYGVKKLFCVSGICCIF